MCCPALAPLRDLIEAILIRFMAYPMMVGVDFSSQKKQSTTIAARRDDCIDNRLGSGLKMRWPRRVIRPQPSECRVKQGQGRVDSGKYSR